MKNIYDIGGRPGIKDARREGSENHTGGGFPEAGKGSNEMAAIPQDRRDGMRQSDFSMEEGGWMLKKLICWAGNIVTGLLLIMVIMAAYFAISSKIWGGAPKVFGCRLMAVLSGSMEPTLHTGSVIAVRPVSDPKALKEGEIVTYKALDNPDMMITHRIKKVVGSGDHVEYITQGDSNGSEDPNPVPAANIVGIYANIAIPLMGYALSVVRTKTGIMLLLIIPGSILILSRIIAVWRMVLKTEDNSKPKTELPPDAAGPDKPV
ncbi:MAG: signal peptidase I [Clostridiales bacterium]|jgi:signal peptidase|nr:signal peptidase I [Eubacteriales bacterium]MDH7566494.1 signal peptidase I [Clostridiales bacterium]